MSISHTRDALLLAWSREPIGVDLERADRRFDAFPLARRFFHPDDCIGLERLPEECCRQVVLRQWLVKEAAIKWHGGQLANELVGWSWVDGVASAIHKPRGLRVRVSVATHQLWCIAVAGGAASTGQNPLICLL